MKSHCSRFERGHFPEAPLAVQSCYLITVPLRHLFLSAAASASPFLSSAGEFYFSYFILEYIFYWLRIKLAGL